MEFPRPSPFGAIGCCRRRLPLRVSWFEESACAKPVSCLRCTTYGGVIGDCYTAWQMFHFGKPKTAGEWVVHVVGAIIALFLIWWMFRLYIV